MLERQKEIESLGRDIFKDIETDSGGSSIFNKDWWYGRIMEWSMRNENFKTQMFRFVDVLPYLKSGAEVARHLKEYFAQSGEKLPSIFNVGLGVGSLAPGLMAGAIRKNVTQMAKLFITGETPKDALPVLAKAWNNRIAFTVDLLGEACLSDKEARDYQGRYLELIEWLSEGTQKWKPDELLDSDAFGPIPRVNISVKLSSVFSQIQVPAWETSKEKIKENLRPILDSALKNGAFINIDMEQYSLKDLTLEVFQELLMEPAYRDYRHWGIVIQAYLRDSFMDLQKLVEFSKKRGVGFSVRLVKGAYWDYETIDHTQKLWPIPVYTNKKESDANFEKCARLLLENYEHIQLCAASHNVRSLASTLVMAENLKVPKNAFEIQMLYGMAEPFKKSFVKQGYRVREYATVGEMIPGMAYLVRRLLENTSNESFLRSKFVENTEDSRLLEDPSLELSPSSPEPVLKDGDFANAPLLDFTQAENRSKVTAALASFKSSLPRAVRPVVNGVEVTSTQESLTVLNPSQTDQVLGTVHLAGRELAQSAVESALETFKDWSKTPVEERAELLEKVADIFERDRFEIMACQILEAGKAWVEADGDVTEAIDFLRYYARQIREISPAKRVGHAPGEVSMYHFTPCGVSLVIAPWNFPLAILTGMVAANLVTGNTVLMKPAEQTSITAQFLMRAMTEAGAPKGALHFLPGRGEDIGAFLAAHKDVSIISFTGSKEVGLQLLETAAKVVPGQKHVKKCITEMGGKNALIIDSDADLDEAVAGVLYSAFGFQGQKCSASSRVLVLEEIYDRFVERLEEAIKSLHVGPSEDPFNYLGPVIDKEAYERIQGMLAVGEKEGRRLPSPAAPEGGYFIPPTAFVDVSPESRIAREEIFGPVVAVIKVKTLQEAVEVANHSEYALTGGLYSRSPSHIDYVKNNLEAGNVYINRAITGAMVDRHPFGGYKLSGTGYKTGGPEYLKQFLNERVVIENTVRRGFAPSEEG